MIAVEPDGSLAEWWDAASPVGQKPAHKVGRMPICWGPDSDECVRRAHERFGWFGGGWKVNAELPSTAGFADATSFVRWQDVVGCLEAPGRTITLRFSFMIGLTGALGAAVTYGLVDVASRARSVLTAHRSPACSVAPAPEVWRIRADSSAGHSHHPPHRDHQSLSAMP